MTENKGYQCDCVQDGSNTYFDDSGGDKIFVPADKIFIALSTQHQSRNKSLLKVQTVKVSATAHRRSRMVTGSRN